MLKQIGTRAKNVKHFSMALPQQAPSSFSLPYLLKHNSTIPNGTHLALLQPFPRVFHVYVPFQGVDSVSKVYLCPDNAKSREEFDQLWNTISGGVKTVPVNLR